MRLLVTGGRNFHDKDRLFAHLEELSPDEIVVGDASGADRLAELWASTNDVPVIKTKAPWSALDKYAGFARNEYMIERYKPDSVLVCPGGNGTRNCQVLAASMGIELIFLKRFDDG